VSAALDDLRARIASIDREIVAALATRSVFCRHARPDLTPGSSAAALDDGDLLARIRADYPRLVAEEISDHEMCRRDEESCQAADRALMAAVLRRLRVVLAVARAKADKQAPQFAALIAARDAAALERAITQPAVEEQVLTRVTALAAEHVAAAGVPARFPTRVAAVYRQWIIPLARRVQVDALLAGRL
jgi:chorismate mutase